MFCSDKSGNVYRTGWSLFLHAPKEAVSLPKIAPSQAKKLFYTFLASVLLLLTIIIFEGKGKESILSLVFVFYVAVPTLASKTREQSAVLLKELTLHKKLALIGLLWIVFGLFVGIRLITQPLQSYF